MMQRVKTEVSEFEYLLSDIIERIIIQMVEREKFVFKEYVGWKCTRQQDTLNGVKKLVERRNLINFQNVVNYSVAVEDKSLKAWAWAHGY